MKVDYVGGIKFFVTENLALRLDVRHIYEVDDRFNNLICSVGIVFRIAP